MLQDVKQDLFAKRPHRHLRHRVGSVLVIKATTEYVRQSILNWETKKSASHRFSGKTDEGVLGYSGRLHRYSQRWAFKTQSLLLPSFSISTRGVYR